MSTAVCLVLTAIILFGVAGALFVHAGVAHHHEGETKPVQLVEHCDSHMLSLPAIIPCDASPDLRADEFSPITDTLKRALFVADIFNPPKA